MLKASNPLIESLAVNAWHFGTIVEVSTGKNQSEVTIAIELDEVQCIVKKTLMIDCFTVESDFFELIFELDVINDEGRVYFDELLYQDVVFFLTESRNGKLFIESIKKDSRENIKKYHLEEICETEEEEGGVDSEI